MEETLTVRRDRMVSSAAWNASIYDAVGQQPWILCTDAPALDGGRVCEVCRRRRRDATVDVHIFGKNRDLSRCPYNLVTFPELLDDCFPHHACRREVRS